MKRNKYLSLIFSIIFFTSCADLDLNPPSEASSENWYSDEEQIEMTVRSLYHPNFWRMDLDTWTDDVMHRFIMTDITGGTITSEFSYGANTWSKAYQAIATTNILIEKMASLDDVIPKEKLERYKGEAHFVRAYEYSLLISHYGDVVYYENYPDIDEAFTFSRTDKNFILQKIYQDFDYAASVLPINYSGTEFRRATKGAALALKSRIALYMGDYKIARDAAKACIDLNTYQLDKDFDKLFLTKNSNEIIFSLPRSVELGVYLQNATRSIEILSGEAMHLFNPQYFLPRNRNGLAGNCPTWDLFCSFLCVDGLPIDESPLFNPKKPFDNRDPRCTSTIVEFGSTFLDVVYQPHPDSVRVYSYRTGGLIRNNDCLTNSEYAAFNGLLFRKGIDETWADDLRADPDKVIIRYADILLMYAEAKVELGEIDGTVLDAINQVRARAYKKEPSQTSEYPSVNETNQVNLRKIVRTERRMEFANEGLRYMDIIRWRLAEKVLNRNNYGILYPVSNLRTKVISKGLWFFPETPDIDDDGVANFDNMFNQGLIRLLTVRKFDANRQYVWPIPSKEVKINSNLVQNPNY